MFRLIPIIISVGIAFSATSITKSVSLSEMGDLVLTWDCHSYAGNKTTSYEELFAKSGDRLRVEKWFVLPDKLPDPESRVVYLGYGSEGNLYLPCCKDKKLSLADFNLPDFLLEIAYQVAWWTDLNNGQVADGNVYIWPYKQVYLSSTGLPTEIRYYHMRIKYSDYKTIPGIGSVPGRIMIYKGNQLILEKVLTVSDIPSDALFNARNLPFKKGDKEIEPVEN